MTADELFTVIGYVDPHYLVESENRRRRITPHIAATAAACLLLGAGLAAPFLHRPAEPPHPEMTATAPPTTPSAAITTSAPVTEHDWGALERAVGGSDMRSMLFLEDAGNLAYLRRLTADEPPLLAEGELDTWVEEVYLALPPDEMDRLPTLYRAIHALGVSRDAFVAVNNLRRASGKSMVLDDAFIDALFADTEEEAVRALLHPFALYADGRVYSWNEMRALRQSGALTLSPEEETAYLSRIEAYCREIGLISP